LLSNYGEVSEVWFDGACGEGPNGRKQVYDWQSYYKVVRELQPNAVIFGMGPDIRWVGTESGYGRETEWCPIRFDPGAADEIPTDTEESSVDNLFTPRDLTSPDLGSREKINDARFLMWYPSEADVSIRPGWFYHQIEDTGVKTPEKLVDIYFSSVGRNSVLLLNIPPDRRGLIHENDIHSLKGMKKILDQTFAENLAVGAKVRASCEGKGHEASHVIDRNRNTYWITRDGVESASLEFDLHGKKTFDCAMLQENISLGQRVEKFCLETWDGTNWIQFGSGTTIGYKRLLRFPAVTTSKVRLVIEQSRTCPSISNFGLFKFPPQVSFLPDGGAFVDSVEVSISTESKDAVIHYTLDGGVPSKRSPFYAKPIKLTQPSIITAIALSKHGVESLPKAATFVKANHGITLNTRYEESYSGGGALALVDGLFGSTDFRDGRWQGYEGVDLDAEIDLGTSMPIYKISARFLQNVESWIFLPKSVEYATSDNGKDFDIVASITNSVYERKEGSIVEPFEKVLESKSGRYVRVRAKNMGICPSWHAGAGGKAWIFVDEVVVN
jgi:alpha-L-fucosidase